MGNEMESVSPHYYQRGVVLNRPMQTMIQQPQAQQCYQTGPLSIKLKQYDLFPGQVAEGSVFLQTPTQMLLNDIYLHLIYTVAWNVQGQMPLAETNEKVIGSICLGIARILNINGALINLNPGKYNFPFQFKIPDNLPPCFEFPKNNVRAYLRYTFRANIYSQFTKGVASLRFFVKANSKIYKTPLGFSSSSPMTMNYGSTTLNATIKGTSYIIKGEIPFTVEIDNSQGKANVKNVLVQIIRRLQLKKVQDIKDRFVIENVISARTYQVNLPPYSKSQVLNYIFQIDDTTIREFAYIGVANPYPRLANIFYVMPSVESLAIKCYYFLVVTLDFAPMLPQQYLPKVIFPIHLNHQEMQDYNNCNSNISNISRIQNPEDLNAPMAVSIMGIQNNGDINNVDLKSSQKENNVVNNEEEQKIDKPKEDNNNSDNNNKEENDVNYDINIRMKDISKIMNDDDDIKVNKNIENIKNELKGILNAMTTGDVENNMNNKEEKNIFDREQKNDNVNNEKKEENNSNNNDNNNKNINNEENNKNESDDKNEFSIFGQADENK